MLLSMSCTLQLPPRCAHRCAAATLAHARAPRCAPRVNYYRDLGHIQTQQPDYFNSAVTGYEPKTLASTALIAVDILTSPKIAP